MKKKSFRHRVAKRINKNKLKCSQHTLKTFLRNYSACINKQVELHIDKLYFTLCSCPRIHASVALCHIHLTLKPGRGDACRGCGASNTPEPVSRACCWWGLLIVCSGTFSISEDMYHYRFQTETPKRRKWFDTQRVLSTVKPYLRACWCLSSVMVIYCIEVKLFYVEVVVHTTPEGKVDITDVWIV